MGHGEIMGYTLIEDDAPAKPAGRYRLVDENEPAIAPSKLKGSTLGGVFMGLRDPIDAGAQLLVRALPESVVNAGDRIGNALADMGLPVARSNGVAGVDAIAKNANAEYDASQKLTGRDGLDVARIVGNVANPVNRVVPISGATNALGIAARAGAQGAISGLATPVLDTDNFGSTKAAQTALGGALGAAGGVVADKVATAGGNALARLKNTPVGRAFSSDAPPMAQAEYEISAAAKNAGIDLSSIPESILQKTKEQVTQALQSGQKIDTQALLRKADFDALNINPTLGQVTRDPTQYTREMNLRGIEGAGEPLANLYNGQNNALINVINRAGASGAPGEMNVSGRIINALSSLDSQAKSKVDQAYTAARDHLGRAAPMDPQQFSTAANNALDEGMLGHYLPGQVRNILNDVATGKIPFNVNTAVQIDSVLSAAQRSGNAAEAKAIGTVRDALNKTKIADNVGEDAKAAFDAARGMAAQRFSKIEQTPALDAVVNKDVQPDKFFQKYILGGTVKDVSGLANTLGDSEKAMVRNQLVDYLKTRALSGASDEVGKFSQSAYNKALNQISDKLPAFFSPADIAQLQRVGRVSSYIQAQPAGSAVNNSNTASAAMNLLSKVGGKVGGLPWVSDFVVKPVQGFADRRAVANALAAKVAPESVESATNALRPYLIPFAGGVGSAAASLAK